MPPVGRRGGKFSKPTRGGGKHFSRDLQPLDKDGNPKGMWRDPADEAESSEEESSEEESTEESEDDEAGPSGISAPAGGQEMSREQRKEAARKKKLAAIAKKNKKVAEVGDMPTSSSEEEEDEDEDGLLANPNHSTKARMQARVATAPSGETALPGRKEKDNLSRREREAIEKEAARERYQKLHAEGKTDEARADLARLRLVKQQREEAAARKKAEQEERDEEQKKRQEEIDEREKKLKAAAMGDSQAKSSKKTKGKK